MAKRKGPSLNRITEQSLYDDVGDQWALQTWDVPPDEVDSLIERDEVRVVVQDHWNRPLRWVSRTEAIAHWREHMRPHLQPDGEMRDGNTRFNVSLYRLGERRLLLLTED
jgi:hypothetical protein